MFLFLKQLKAVSKLPSNSALTKRPSLGATVNDRTTNGAGAGPAGD